MYDTPWKINMEPTNHPFRKENDLPNPHDYVSMLIFRGVYLPIDLVDLDDKCRQICTQFDWSEQ